MARLAIVGSRCFCNLDLVERFVRHLRADTVVVSGGARGVDRIAVAVAESLGRSVDVFLPDWSLGRGAGFVRNQAVVDSLGVGDGLVAFWDGSSRGTEHVVRLALARGLWVRVYRADGSFSSSL